MRIFYVTILTTNLKATKNPNKHTNIYNLVCSNFMIMWSTWKHVCNGPMLTSTNGTRHIMVMERLPIISKSAEFVLSTVHVCLDTVMSIRVISPLGIPRETNRFGCPARMRILRTAYNTCNLHSTSTLHNYSPPDT